jgi:alkane 1-monooxygenase
LHNSCKCDTLRREIKFRNIRYSHFPIEHVYGHHKNVGTDADPATARRNETIYTFVPRSVLGTLKHTWYIENERLRAKYDRDITLSTFLREHRIFWSIIFGDIVLPIMVYLIMGSAACLTFILQAFISIMLTESTNYLEHYGLRRKKLESDAYEPVSEKHSWDAPYTISNYLYINLMLHADHHAHPMKPYHLLQPGPVSTPQLPYGYATLFLMALIPPIYFNVMHKLPALQNQ